MLLVLVVVLMLVVVLVLVGVMVVVVAMLVVNARWFLVANVLCNNGEGVYVFIGYSTI